MTDLIQAPSFLRQLQTELNQAMPLQVGPHPVPDLAANLPIKPLRTSGRRMHGWGTIIRLSDDTWSTALHVTEETFVDRIEAIYGKCIKLREEVDLHIFSSTGQYRLPSAEGILDGDEITIAGYPAGATRVPELYYGRAEFRHDDYDHSRMRWASVNESIVGGVSGGSVYRGILTLTDIATATPSGYIRAQGDIIDDDGTLAAWGLFTTWGDLI